MTKEIIKNMVKTVLKIAGKGMLSGASSAAGAIMVKTILTDKTKGVNTHKTKVKEAQ